MLSDRTQKTLGLVLFFVMLVWGAFLFISFTGVDQQFTHLMSEKQSDAVQATIAVCPDKDSLCLGLAFFWPAVVHAFARAFPFVPYAVSSLVVIGLYVGWRRIKAVGHGNHLRLAAWSLWPIFLLAVWLLFTSLSVVDIGQGIPLRQLPDPTAPAFPRRLNPEALQAIDASFQSLQSRGCLTPAPPAGAIPLFEMKQSCIQQSFFTVVLPAFLFVSAVALDFLVLGTLLFGLLRLRPQGLPQRQAWVLSLGLGAGGVITVLWTLALLGAVASFVGWAFLVAIPLLGWKTIRRLWCQVREVHITFPSWWGGAPLFLGWLLLTLFALNFLSVIRPFPIGWDDLGSYLARPRLFIEYGHFIPTMASLQWEYVTSLGFWLFGSATTFGAVASLLMNWLAGPLAVFALIAAANLILGRGGLLAGVFYAFLPMVGHFSFADMKIDNAVFFMTALATICVFAALFPAEPGEKNERSARLKWTILAGIFTGLAFGFKATAVMSLLGLLVLIAGVNMGPWAAVSGTFLAITMFLLQGLLNISQVASRFIGSPVAIPQLGFAVATSISAVIFFWIAFAQKRSAWRQTFLDVASFMVGTIIVVSPWVAHNVFYNGQWPPSTVLSADDRSSPVISFSSSPTSATRRVVTLPAELAVDPKSPACAGNESEGALGGYWGQEPLDRYWGQEVGPAHYLLLPWRVVMNLNNGGYYVTTTPLMLFLPLLLLLPLFWTPAGQRLRWLFLFTFVQIGEWIFLANGVIWYGLGMFLGFAVLIEALFRNGPDRRTRWLGNVFFGLSLLFCISFRIWQFELQPGQLEFVIGAATSDVVYATSLPFHQQISRSVVARAKALPDAPYTLRIGTNLRYFIPRSTELLPFDDNLLDLFSCAAQYDPPSIVTRRLKALGFNGIIFDTTTATLEDDVNGTLHRRVQRFLHYASDSSSGLKAPVVDPDRGVAYWLLP